MSVHAHPRFLRRRSNVREHRARRHLRRALWVLLVVASAWMIFWVAQSPFFSVASINVEGARQASVQEVLAAFDVYEGRPLVLIRPDAIEEALADDPWVKEASVWRRFPDRIEIEIVERFEVAVVPADDGWRTVSDDGHIMVSVADPPDRLAVISPEVAYAGRGGDTVSATMMGVVEFLAALPAELIKRTTISASAAELAAEIDGHRIRLGPPTNMAAKAAALVAILADDRLAPDAVVDLIAPERPAVHPPPPDPSASPPN